MKAFFARQAEATSDKTGDNKIKIEEEFLRRKKLREAKAKKLEAEEEANRQQTPEEIAEISYQKARRASIQRQEAEKKEKEDEIAARKARKEALNAKWSGKL